MPGGTATAASRSLGPASGGTLAGAARDMSHPCRPRPGNSRGHIFLIFKYCRISGNDMTARSPRAAAEAAMVIAEMYPSVRIVCLLFFS